MKIVHNHKKPWKLNDWQMGNHSFLLCWRRGYFHVFQIHGCPVFGRTNNAQIQTGKAVVSINLSIQTGSYAIENQVNQTSIELNSSGPGGAIGDDNIADYVSKPVANAVQEN